MSGGRNGDAGKSGTGRPSGAAYEPPRLVSLGTLAELTRGGTAGPPDAFGGAGDSGSL